MTRQLFDRKFINSEGKEEVASAKATMAAIIEASGAEDKDKQQAYKDGYLKHNMIFEADKNKVPPEIQAYLRELVNGVRDLKTAYMNR